MPCSLEPIRKALSMKRIALNEARQLPPSGPRLASRSWVRVNNFRCAAFGFEITKITHCGRAHFGEGIMDSEIHN